MRRKKIFRKIDKFYPDPEGFSASNILCINDIARLKDILKLYIEQGKENYKNKTNWIDLYLSEFECQPASFHESYYQSILEDYIFYTIQASKFELYLHCDELKKCRMNFIETMVKIYKRLNVQNVIKKRNEIEEWDNKIYNQYFELFENKLIEEMGIEEIYYFND